MPKVFVSYSSKDRDLLEEFDTHTATLKRAELIESWTDRDIPWGGEWEKKLWEEFHAANIIVLLVSADFLASKYAYDKEFAAARERHERGEVRILPVIVTECDWQDGHIDKFQVVQFEKAASVWGHGDHPRHRAPAWTAVAKQLRQVAEELKAQTKVVRPPKPVAPEPPRIVVPEAPAVIVHRAGDVTDIGGLPYIWIPPGKFLMGADPEDTEAYENEHPPHEVTITKGFWLGKYLVTQAAYRRVIGENPSNFNGPNRPVERVSWDNANTYAETLGGGVRLPTEGEWEFAVRAGTSASRYGELDRIAWCRGSGGQTHDVGGKAPNGWGLHDMLGNVWEWVGDLFGDYLAEPSTDPRGPRTGVVRVLRGGSFQDDPAFCRASIRRGEDPLHRYSYIGFRCAAD